MFSLNVPTGDIRRLTTTKSAEYHPAFSPDGSRIAFTGTTRDLTSSETTMEDTHVWVMRADGTGRVEVGKAIDNRQGAPRWSADGRQLISRSRTAGTQLMAANADASATSTLVGKSGSVGAFGVARKTLAYAFATPQALRSCTSRSCREAPKALTALNQSVLGAPPAGRDRSVHVHERLAGGRGVPHHPAGVRGASRRRSRSSS